MIKIKNGLWLLLMIGIGLVAMSPTIWAEEEPQGFFYEVKYPENQQGDAGYFDLKMSAGQKQTVQIVLRNLSAEALTVNVQLNGAKTNSNGVLEYGPTKLPNDSSLKFDFADIVSAPEKVTLQANEEKIVDIAIAMPETTYDGVIAGGIQLQQEVSESENQEANGGANIVNRYAYLIALLLRETTVDVQPELMFNKAEAGQSNYRNTVFVNLSNTQAAYLSDLVMDVQITKKGSDNVLYETKKTGMKMAPNSFIHFPIGMNGEEMEAGNYQAKIVATSGDRSWTWDEPFSITKSQADKFNQDDLSLIQTAGINWLVIAGIACGIFALVVGIFMGIRIRRSKQEAKVKRKKRK